MTDFITLILSFVFLARGASLGFLNALMMPVAIIITSLIDFMYFQLTQEIILTLIIGIAGPFLLCLLFKYLLKMWAKATNSEIKPSFLSRLGGSMVTLTWGWVFISFTLIFLALLPAWGDNLTAMHNDLTKSASYYFAKPLGESFLGSSQQNTTFTASNSPAITDAKSLADDPRFKTVLEDPDVKKEIDAHDIVKLLSNPKMIALTQQIMNDPVTMKKVVDIYSSQAPSQTPKTP